MRQIALGLLVALGVAVPALAWAESGRVPMIDRHGELWVLPAALVVAGVFAGGLRAGHREVRLTSALAVGATVGTLCTAVLLAADLVRRGVLGHGVPEGVALLWLDGALVTIVVALCGAVAGSLLTRPRTSQSGHGYRAALDAPAAGPLPGHHGAHDDAQHGARATPARRSG